MALGARIRETVDRGLTGGGSLEPSKRKGGRSHLLRAVHRRLRVVSVIALALELQLRVGRARGDVRVEAHEEKRGENDADRRPDKRKPPSRPHRCEDDEAERVREVGAARMRPEEAREEERRRRDPEHEPGPQPPEPRRGEQKGSHEHVRGCERRQEERDKPAQRVLVPGVVDEVLRQAGKTLVVEAKLLREPARGAGVAPPRERDRVDVDQAERGDERGRGEDRRPDPPEVTLRHRESPAEEVGGNRKQIVTHAQNDAAMRGTSVEPVLRDHAPDENDGAVGEREPIDEGRAEAQ